MKKEVDARGLSCPAPVLQTKAVIDSESPDSIEVIVDNEAAGQNIRRFLESQKYQVSEKRNG